MKDNTAQWVVAVSFAVGVGAYCVWLYSSWRDDRIRMKDHEWFMDQAKVAAMERKLFDDS